MNSTHPPLFIVINILNIQIKPVFDGVVVNARDHLEQWDYHNGNHCEWSPRWTKGMEERFKLTAKTDSDRTITTISSDTFVERPATFPWETQSSMLLNIPIKPVFDGVVVNDHPFGTARDYHNHYTVKHFCLTTLNAAPTRRGDPPGEPAPARTRARASDGHWSHL